MVLVMIDQPCGPLVDAFRLVSDGPQLKVTDLAVTRGDGIFETALVRGGVILSEERHLIRLERSAAMLDLPTPDREVYRAATRAAVAELDEGFVKYVLSRGDEENPAGPLGWAFATSSPDLSDQRGVGIAVVLLDRGYSLDVPHTSPWLLAGAKTLSYAVNKAVLREAARRGASDVIFTSTDGYLLEGPTSTLVARFGDELVTTRPEGGVLPGTTQEDLFDALGPLGLRGVVRDVRVEELAKADAVWLVSSIRLAMPVNAIDGVAIAVDHELTERFTQILQARTS